MSALKFIFIFYICANCVSGLYVPSSSDGVETDDKKLIDDLAIVKQKLQPNDKGVSGLDEFDVTKNVLENLLTKGSSSYLNDRTVRFIDFNKLIKHGHHRNRYNHNGRNHYTKKHDHNYCDHRSSEESIEDNTSAFNDWVKYYKQFMAQLATLVNYENSVTEKPTTTTTTTLAVAPTTVTLTSSMAHYDVDDEINKIDVGLDEDFNEFELIRLIPSVIEQLKTNRLTARDRNVLSQIYGDLWLVMDEESKRDREHEKINPILKLILQFKHKREIDRHAYTNDFHGNTLDQIRNNDRDIIDQPLRIKIGLTENLAQLSPSQRILRTIAMLINNTQFNYSAPGHKKHMVPPDDRKMIKKRKHMRVRPNVIRMRRSPLRHQTLNNNVGNDIDSYDSNEQFYRRRMSSFDDNPSITELIKLAEIHRLRRQQKFNKNSMSLIDKLYSANASDNYEYYYDDEPEPDDNNVADEQDDEYEQDDGEYDY